MSIQKSEAEAKDQVLAGISFPTIDISFDWLATVDWPKLGKQLAQAVVKFIQEELLPKMTAAGGLWSGVAVALSAILPQLQTWLAS